MIFQIFKPFLNEKMRERLFIHGSDFSSLHEHVDKAHLPKKYGGEMPEYPYTKWMESLRKNESVRDELKQLGYVFDSEEFWNVQFGRNFCFDFIFRLLFIVIYLFEVSFKEYVHFVLVCKNKQKNSIVSIKRE